MALDLSKLTAVVSKVADLAHQHASLSALAADAKGVESAAQKEIDTVVASLEVALGSVSHPITSAGAAGLAAVASALHSVEVAVGLASDPAPAPVSPTQAPAEAVAPVASPVPSVAETMAAAAKAAR
jgi:hypothetical protein